MFHSIRRQLPFSYAAIALLAALALGAILLITLRGYYLRVERDYLQSNAQAIGFSLAQILEEDKSADVIQAQANSFSFLSQTRVRVFDSTGQMVAASGSPATYRVMIAASSEDIPLLQRERQTGQEGRLRPFITILPGLLPSGTLTTTAGTVLPVVPRGERRLTAVEYLRRSGILPRATDQQAAGSFSSQVAQQPIYNSGGTLLGYVELSQGPAYAREIVGDVGWRWAAAGAVAVVLAASVGWLISRRIATPLLALTEATTSMAKGDLAVRAEVNRADELGTLGRAFNVMADRVQENIAALRRFVSDAAHEIHTPLTALHTSLELAPQEEHVVLARTQVQRLEALTAGLLDLSRIESGSQEPSFAPVFLGGLAEAASERYASRAEQAGLDFELSVPAEPLRVLGDEEQLGRALANLLDNAIKFTPPGGTIRLRLWQEKQMAVLSVEDTGIGILEEDCPYLFQRFRRGRNAASIPGSGLGLAVVKAIVERHGGSVAAESTNQGARFTMRIPIA